MAASILIQDDSFELLDDSAPIGARRALDGDALAYLTGLARRYALLEQRPDPAAAQAIGRDLYRWLDGDERQLGRLIEQAARPLLLAVHCPSRRPSPVEWSLLHAPWELLADERGYLAADAAVQPPASPRPERSAATPGRLPARPALHGRSAPGRQNRWRTWTLTRCCSWRTGPERRRAGQARHQAIGDAVPCWGAR